MSANVESMFYVREAPWHGLGQKVEKALCSQEALQEAGLDWKVIQRSLLTDNLMDIPGFKANIRNTDQQLLGIVTDRYSIVQNHEAFAFTDELLGEGVQFETAGSLQNGRKVWMLARLPNNYIFAGDVLSPYLVFFNSHDGSSGIKVAMTPIRVVCQNTLNLALRNAKRVWTTNHTGDMKSKLDEAKKTLLLAEYYMNRFGTEVDRLNKIKISDSNVLEYIEQLFPMADLPTNTQKKNVHRLRSDIQTRYFEAPDLTQMDKNGYRFINAVSDFATHAKPLRETTSYKENLFIKTTDGHPIIDKAYEMILELA